MLFGSHYTCKQSQVQKMEAQKKQISKSLYMDLMKAFDKVLHGISGETLSWIREFLHERRQKVVINGESSSWNYVNSGSVLGPVLFVLFINDLPDTIQSLLYIFAYDTKVFNLLISSYDANKFQQDLVELHLWTE